MTEPLARQFRNAYVIEDDYSYDFTGLHELAGNISALLISYKNDPAWLRKTIEQNLQDYDPEMDLIVPVGHSLAVYIAADIISKFGRGRHMYIAVYRLFDRSYTVVDLHGPQDTLTGGEEVHIPRDSIKPEPAA